MRCKCASWWYATQIMLICWIDMCVLSCCPGIAGMSRPTMSILYIYMCTAHTRGFFLYISWPLMSRARPKSAIFSTNPSAMSTFLAARSQCTICGTQRSSKGYNASQVWSHDMHTCTRWNCCVSCTFLGHICCVYLHTVYLKLFSCICTQVSVYMYVH